MALSLFATVPAGMESMLAGELRGLGADDVRQTRAGAAFSGSLETAYRVCLWSRLAARVLLAVETGPAGDAEALYDTVRRVAWADHLAVDGTLAVDFTGASPTIRDTRFGAMRVKDAIVDQFRETHGGRRPSVDARAPDVRVNAHLARGRVTVSVDLSGESLHRRGYRTAGTGLDAPLKENLAAAMLLFAAWPREAAAGGSLFDPLCGSATLPIEAAWMAADVAPGLLRAEGHPRGEARDTTRAEDVVRRSGAAPRGFGFSRWAGHDAETWGALVREARERRSAGLDRLRAQAPGLVIGGADHDPRAVGLARACVARAGLGGCVVVERADLADARPPAAHGLLAANAPYGQRLGDPAAAQALCRLLGRRLHSAFSGWRAVVLTGDAAHAAELGLQPARQTVLRNGALDCTLTYVDVDAPGMGQAARKPSGPARETIGPASEADISSPRLAQRAPSGADQLANRLRRNLRHTGRTMRRQGVTCYRIYDADLPEYNLAVDVYEGRLHVQEYAPPPEIDPDRAAAHLAEAVAVLGEVLGVAPRDIVVKQRRRMRGAAQYERRAGGGDLLQPVSEDGLTYLVDLETYLDTGLFLDQRETRRLIRRLAGGRRFLNLFAYTCTATICAIAGGASSTTSVDLSATYLEWARKNLLENGVRDVDLELARSPVRRSPDAPDGSGRARAASSRSPGGAHRLVQADCLRWIAETEGQYDLIFLDPPSFSNSKRMGRATFDVQRDHPDLIRMTVRRMLAPRGILLFSSNRRGFKLDPTALPSLTLKDLSRATLAADFARRANTHHLWRIETHAAARTT